MSRRAVAIAALWLCGAACPSEAPEDPPDEPPCPAGEVQDDDSGACLPEACGTSRWGTAARTGATVHADPAAAPGGDGSDTAPLVDLQEAADLAGSRGSQLVLAAGRYPAALVLGPEHQDLALVGRCRELVVLDASGTDDRPAGLTIRGGGMSLGGFALEGSLGGLQVEDPDGAGVDLRIERVEVRDSDLFGLVVRDDDTSVLADDLWIHGTQADAEGLLGHGVQLAGGARLEADDLRVEDNHELGMAISGGGTRAVLRGGAVRGTRELPVQAALGLFVGGGASLLAVDLLIEDNPGIGLQVSGWGSEAELRGGAVRGTRTDATGRGGNGVSAFGSGDIVLRDVLVEDNQNAGVYSDGTGSRVEVYGGEVRGTIPRDDGGAGQGLRARNRGSLHAEDVLVVGNHGQGVRAEGEDTAVELVRVTVRDTRPGPTTVGRGIAVGEGAALVGRSLTVVGNHGVGVLVTGPGSRADLEDVRIEGTLPQEDGRHGGGVAVQDGAAATALRIEVIDNHEHGVQVLGPSTLALDDSLIQGTRMSPDGSGGRGLLAQAGALVTGEDNRILDNHDSGVAVLGSGARVELTGGRIAGTRSALNVRSGLGVAADLLAEAVLVDVEIADNEGPGAYAVEGATVTLTDCALSGNGLAGAVIIDGALEMIRGSVRGSTPHPSEGGGVGVLAWSAFGPPWLEVSGTAFSDLPGSAFYLRGPGRYRISGATVERAGGWPAAPGGVLATEGVAAWDGASGLLLEGNSFDALGSDALLLDGSAATLAPHPQSAAPQAFGALEGEPLFVQRCAAPSTTQVLDGSGADPACRSAARPLGPLLEYRLRVGEADVVQ